MLYISVSALSYTNAVCTNIADSVFRLHVVANSDTDADQNLKYIVLPDIYIMHTMLQGIPEVI